MVVVAGEPIEEKDIKRRLRAPPGGDWAAVAARNAAAAEAEGADGAEGDEGEDDYGGGDGGPDRPKAAAAAPWAGAGGSGAAPRRAGLIEILAVEHGADAASPGSKAFWMVYVRGTWFKHWRPVWTFRKREPRRFPALEAVRTFRDRVGTRAPVVVRFAGSRELLAMRGVAPSCGGPVEVRPPGQRPLSWAGRAGLGLPHDDGDEDGDG